MTPQEEFIEIYNKYITRQVLTSFLNGSKEPIFLLPLQVQNIIVPVKTVL